MSEIEWQSKTTYQPANISLAAYLRLRGIQPRPAGRSRNEPVNPLVYITDSALEGLNIYLESDISREHGGVLVGLPFIDTETGRVFVDIRAAIPAMNSEGSPTSMQFNPDAWDYISGLIEESFPGHMIVGWFHSHPGLGVYMSGTDQATQRSFYPHPWNLALVVDPLAHNSAWFAGAACVPLMLEEVTLYLTGSTSEKADRLPDLSDRQEIAPGFRQNHLIMNRLAWLLPLASLLLILIYWLPQRMGMRS
jgi:proteasome lid subunit RPN8/RPN11